MYIRYLRICIFRHIHIYIFISYILYNAYQVYRNVGRYQLYLPWTPSPVLSTQWVSLATSLVWIRVIQIFMCNCNICAVTRVFVLWSVWFWEFVRWVVYFNLFANSFVAFKCASDASNARVRIQNLSSISLRRAPFTDHHHYHHHRPFVKGWADSESPSISRPIPVPVPGGDGR